MLPTGTGRFAFRSFSGDIHFAAAGSDGRAPGFTWVLPESWSPPGLPATYSRANPTLQRPAAARGDGIPGTGGRRRRHPAPRPAGRAAARPDRSGPLPRPDSGAGPRADPLAPTRIDGRDPRPARRGEHRDQHRIAAVRSARIASMAANAALYTVSRVSYSGAYEETAAAPSVTCARTARILAVSCSTDRPPGTGTSWPGQPAPGPARRGPREGSRDCRLEIGDCRSGPKPIGVPFCKRRSAAAGGPG